MRLIAAGEITRKLNVSERMLRYYEQIGLIESVKTDDDCAACVYTEETVSRLRQILALRKLRIPTEQIALILQAGGAAEIIEALRHSLFDIGGEVASLPAIREKIGHFMTRLNESVCRDIRFHLPDDAAMLEAADALAISPKPPKFSMGFDIAHNDREMIEAFALYQEAFGAEKVAEFTPPGPNRENLHIVMEIYGVEVLLHPVGYGEERIQAGGIWAYDNEDDLRRTIAVLSREARSAESASWPHWPVCAFITDKYGVAWTLHN